MERRTKRLWTDEEKRTIGFQTTAPGVSVAQVARRYAMNANMIFKWLREALADPDHEQHDDMVSWSGAAFDPEDARIERIDERLDQLAKKWAPRPRKPKAPKATP